VPGLLGQIRGEENVVFCLIKDYIFFFPLFVSNTPGTDSNVAKLFTLGFYGPKAEISEHLGSTAHFKKY
jgi:hypothetical protein